MTRIDKLVSLRKGPSISNKIDLQKCSDEELDKLLTISNNLSKSIPRSAADWQLINSLEEQQIKMNPIGSFAKSTN